MNAVEIADSENAGAKIGGNFVEAVIDLHALWLVFH
jgi:hypothetical protein